MDTDIIEKIKNHILGNEEAFSLYFLFCDHLKEKYGFVDRDYDNAPTRKWNEWLDIHHILEYKFNDIARKTEQARYIEKRRSNQSDHEIIVISTNEFDDDKKKKRNWTKISQ